MIAYLSGKIFKKEPNRIILLVNNVGYEVLISLNTFKKTNRPDEDQALFIHTVHKEDAFQLYGFHDEQEKEFFRILISLSGIGPKMALALLSHLEIETLKKAVARQDIGLLTKVGGIGRKRAEKLIFELKEKLDTVYTDTGERDLRKDVIQALENLGYSITEASEMVRRVEFDNTMPVEELIRKVLSAK
ncbi:MAG: Holliday junction branch migration protein RuvA [bacterium]|nr:Holliday junction branch migration protein RuvA [bacterium]